MDPSFRPGGPQTVTPNQTVSPDQTSTTETETSQSARSKRLNRKVAARKGSPTTGLRTGKGKKSGQSYFRTILAKVRPVKTPLLSPAQATAVATQDGKTLSSETLYLVSGASSRPGKHLKALGAELDRYNQEVCSELSSLSPFEKTMRTLELKEKVQTYLERKEKETTLFYKSKEQAQQRIAAANALEKQLGVFFQQQVAQAGTERKSFSKELCDCLCHDIQKNRAKLFATLFREPKVIKTLVSQMELRDLHQFARVHGQIVELSDPDGVKALTSACWNVVKHLDSEQIKEQIALFYQDTHALADVPKLTGNPDIDRRAEFLELMRILLDVNVGTEEAATSTYQAYKDGFLTMNLLDEMLDAKIAEFGYHLEDQQQVDEAVKKLDYDTVTQLHVCELIPGLEVDADKRAQVFALAKLHGFAAMLEVDESGDMDSEYSNFVRTWDQIRYKAIPDYNLLHQKDGLVDVNLLLSRELVKITPQWLTELDAATGDPKKVEALLKKAGLRKAPDHFKFKDAIKKAQKDDKEEQAARFEQAAVQDCLYRYFELRSGVTIPVVKPKPKMT